MLCVCVCVFRTHRHNERRSIFVVVVVAVDEDPAAKSAAHRRPISALRAGVCAPNKQSIRPFSKLDRCHTQKFPNIFKLVLVLFHVVFPPQSAKVVIPRSRHPLAGVARSSSRATAHCWRQRQRPKGRQRLADVVAPFGGDSRVPGRRAPRGVESAQGVV